MGAPDVVDAPSVKGAEEAPTKGNEKQSATCGCIFLVVILGIVIALSFWACKACRDDGAPTTSQAPSSETSTSPVRSAAASASPTPSTITSASPVTSSPAPSAATQYADDELAGSWVTTEGTDITLSVLKNGDRLSAVLSVPPRQQVYFQPAQVSADTFRGKASTLTKDYVYLRFKSADALSIWFTATDGSKVRGTLHPNTYQPSPGGGSYGGGSSQSSSRTYTMAQYSRLAVGMTFEQVDAIMGGGGIMVAQEDAWSMLVYQNIDAAGSQIICSFEYDILVDYREEGL